jgi:hypothetical protein
MASSPPGKKTPARPKPKSGEKQDQVAPIHDARGAVSKYYTTASQGFQTAGSAAVAYNSTNLRPDPESDTLEINHVISNSALTAEALNRVRIF